LCEYKEEENSNIEIEVKCHKCKSIIGLKSNNNKSEIILIKKGEKIAVPIKMNKKVVDSKDPDKITDNGVLLPFNLTFPNPFLEVK
jgi:hypothetical protein